MSNPGSPAPRRALSRTALTIAIVGSVNATVPAMARPFLERGQQEVVVEPVEFEHADEAREGPGFLVVADRRVFAVMAFVNAAGYDREMAPEMHPVRARVRSLMTERLDALPEVRQRLRVFYEELVLPNWVYLDYSLSLSPDYPFRRVRPDDELGYPNASDRIDELPALLNELWDTAGLAEVWEAVKADYAAELSRYDFDLMAHQLDTLWGYLRMERQDPFVLVNVPNLLESYYQAIGAQYGRYYYQVESPGSHGYGLNVHEYLHSVVNPLMARWAPEFSDKIDAYFEHGRNGPMARSYQSPVSMAQESMVRALDHRIRLLLDDSAENHARLEARVTELTNGGLAFTRPFFDLLLAGFEESDARFDDYMPRLLRDLPQLDAR